MRKTTANKLLTAITDNLVSVTSAVVNHDEGMKEPISVEKIHGRFGVLCKFWHICRHD